MAKLHPGAKFYLSLLIALVYGTLVSACNDNQINPQSVAVVTPLSVVSQDWHYRWLRGEPCRAPCWEGITPGSTTASEAVKLLQQNPLILNVSDHAPVVPGSSSITWGWAKDSKRAQSGWGGDALYAPNDSTQKIFAVRPSLVGFLLFSQIKTVYGNPTHVIATLTLNPEGGKYSYELWLVYLNYGFIVRTGNANSVKPELTDATTFEALDFFVPNLDGFKALSEVRARIMVSWQGVRPFEFYCRDASGDGSQNCTKQLNNDNTRNH